MQKKLIILLTKLKHLKHLSQKDVKSVLKTGYSWTCNNVFRRWVRWDYLLNGKNLKSICWMTNQTLSMMKIQYSCRWTRFGARRLPTVFTSLRKRACMQLNMRVCGISLGIAFISRLLRLRRFAARSSYFQPTSTLKQLKRSTASWWSLSSTCLN